MTGAQSAREPIDLEKPAGQDLSFDPEFEAVSREIAKLESVEGGIPKWAEVERAGDRLLRERTKDLRLVVWAGVAKVTLRDFEGLADALGLYLDVLSFWDVLYPPVRRLKARANLHEWFIQHALVPLEMRDVAASDEGALLTAQATLAEVDAIVSDKLADLHPGSARLRSLLQRKLEVLPQPEERIPASVAEVGGSSAPSPDGDAGEEIIIEEEPGEGEPGPESAAPPPRARRMHASSEAPAPSRPVLAYELGGPGAAPTTIDASLDALLVAARLLREENATDARAFRLRRAVIAIRFDPADSLEAPDPADRARLAELFARGELASVAEQAEDAILQRPAWLDAHRWVALALGRSGGMWASAREVAVEETMAMVTRLPALLDRRFTDDTPVADADTLAWLASERKRALGTTAPGLSDTRLDDHGLAQVQELAAQDRVMEAITLATSLANRAGDARGRFQGYLLAGTTALHAGKAAIARPLLEGLLTLVERHELETWEPALCATLYASLLRCLRALAGPEAQESSREKDLFDRLCRLDPAAAMRLGASP